MRPQLDVPDRLLGHQYAVQLGGTHKGGGERAAKGDHRAHAYFWTLSREWVLSIERTVPLRERMTSERVFAPPVT